MRVFLGPVEVAGYYVALQRGFDRIGVRTVRVDLARDRRIYDDGSAPLLARLIVRVTQRSVQSSTRYSRMAWSKLQSLLRILFLCQLATTCDAFIYSFAATITWYPHWELRLLRQLGKRIVFVYHGSDSRPPYLDGQLLASDRAMTVASCAAETKRRKAHLTMLDAFADAVVDNPFSAHLHSRRCINWHVIGIPSISAVAHTVHADDHPVRILHCPSHPETKGTPLIREAIARLQNKGLDIEYVEIVGQPHATVLSEISRSHFVIDQAYSDTPMAGFATEAAAMGRPAIVGGLAGDVFSQFIPDFAMPPVLYCHPQHMEQAIERLVTDRELREALGRAAHDFVSTYRDPSAVAKRYVDLINGEIPEHFFFDPAEIRYAGGMGLPPKLQQMIRDLVSSIGPSSLHLDDKPALRKLVIEFGLSGDQSVTVQLDADRTGVDRTT